MKLTEKTLKRVATIIFDIDESIIKGIYALNRETYILTRNDSESVLLMKFREGKPKIL